MTPTPHESVVRGYAPLHGLRMYYEVHGAGPPLVLIHGGLGLTEMFGDLLPRLAASRQVIVADLQGHGRTADSDRPLQMELLADDIAALIGHLGLAQVDLMGYSIGGGTATCAGSRSSMETFIHEVVGEGALCCLIPCVIIMVTPVIMLWSLIVGRMGPDASDDKVCDTFWRVMRRLIETI